MDPVAEIKARLPIEELVGRYCALKKKGRNYVALCPFHHDTHPSMLVSPDKGIAYCFPCQKGGDIFSFYQQIEGVDFPQALRDLAEKAGVTLEERHTEPVKRDEKERIRGCLGAALHFFRDQLSGSVSTQKYLEGRGVMAGELDEFEIGFAPEGGSLLYEYLLKEGFSRGEILGAGLGIQRELAEGKVLDRFRNRVMFPLYDTQGNICGFGGRTLGKDDAKYINSPDGPLYKKSSVLFGLNLAKSAMRELKDAVIVEGYFDVLACRRAGVRHVVAPCGTALTEDHVRILRRSCEKVTLCFDQDRAGREAAERSFCLLSSQGLSVACAVLPGKDPDEVAKEGVEALRVLLIDKALPYIDVVLSILAGSNAEDITVKRAALARLLPLLAALPTSVERTHYMQKAASALRTTETAFADDLHAFTLKETRRESSPAPLPSVSEFSTVEVALGLFLLYPRFLPLLPELIAPSQGIPASLYTALRALTTHEGFSVEALALKPEEAQRAHILQLFCEQHGFGDWSESVAGREIRKNIGNANREIFHEKQKEISGRLLEAAQSGKSEEEQHLRNQYQELLKLAKMAA